MIDEITDVCSLVLDETQLARCQQDHLAPARVLPVRFQHLAALFSALAGDLVRSKILLKCEVEEAILPQTTFGEQAGFVAGVIKKAFGYLYGVLFIKMLIPNSLDQPLFPFIQRGSAARMCFVQPVGQLSHDGQDGFLFQLFLQPRRHIRLSRPP